MSTFDVFSTLPLFSQIERERLYELIPRISLDFDHADAGQTIAEAGRPVNGLIFLLKGKIQIQNASGKSFAEGPELLGWQYVYGSSGTFSDTLTAQTACSLLLIDKPSLQVLFVSEPAFLKAYLDLLSDAIPTSTNSLL